MIDNQTMDNLIRLQAKAKRRGAISLYGHARDNQSDGITSSQIDIKYPEEVKTDHIKRRTNQYMHAVRMI